ncbi:T9SS type A sorting domain-containing protein, partial [bacterium]|nr:T9SS type A sorting domain-containing protein [bacterium]
MQRMLSALVIVTVALILTIPTVDAQIVQSGDFIVDLQSMERAKIVSNPAYTDVELLTNTGFETGVITPWTHDGYWSVTTTSPNSGMYCATDIGNHWMRQDFTPTPSADIVSATLYCRQPEAAIAAIDFFYSDGTYDEELIWPTAAWEQYDVAFIIAPGRTVVAIRVWGYSGGGPDPDETYYDDFSIQTAGGGTMTIDLTYVSGSPVPASGGNIYYEIFGENVGAAPINFDGWLDVSYQGGTPTTIAQRYFANFQPGWSINRPDMFFPVPSTYAAGDYMFGAKVGGYPSNIWDEDAFPFIKTGADFVPGFVPFIPDGTPDPFEIIERSSVAVASDHLMLTNYPNPFNPETTISFALPEACQISLTVYDVAGRNVVSLIDGWREAGSHEISFNASHLPSGVY